MKYNKNGFTFVELIVVIAILAILSTLSFGVFQEYISSSRDSNRVVQVSEISAGLQRISIESKLPYPEEKVSIDMNTQRFSYQGVAGPSVIQAIGYDGGGLDPDTKEYFTYALGKNLRNFQILGFIKDKTNLSQIPQNKVFADSLEYASYFPIVGGDPLGVFLEKDSQTPLNIYLEGSGSYDVILGGLSTSAILSENESLDNSISGNFYQLIPNSSCKRIMEMGKSQGSGIYNISPNGIVNIRTYCEMDNNSGGWTRVFSHNASGGLYFSNNPDAVFKNAGNPNEKLYSILQYLPNFKRDGKYTFWLRYPEYNTGTGGNIWTQTSNPTTDASVVGYVPIQIQYTANSWAGLKYSGSNKLMNSGTNNYVIASYVSGSFLGPSFSVFQVELYVK